MSHLFYFHDLGYLGLFLSLALGIIGVPIPDEALMTYVGFMVYKGSFSLAAAILVSFLGSITGMSLSYFIGRGIFRALAERLKTKYGESYTKYQALLSKYGGLIIIVGYFFPLIRHLTAYSSGVLKVKYTRFIAFASVGGIVWTTTFILLGFIFGPEWNHIYEFILRYKALAITLFLVYFLLLLYLGRKKMSPDNE